MKSIHELKNDKDHVSHPSHGSKAHMRSMAQESMPEGSPQEEAAESPAMEAQEQQMGIE